MTNLISISEICNKYFVQAKLMELPQPQNLDWCSASPCVVEVCRMFHKSVQLQDAFKKVESVVMEHKCVVSCSCYATRYVVAAGSV
jgi:hypothetical protein